MRKPLIRPIHIWAMRDLLRRPSESLLTAAALFFTIALVGTALLVPHAISSTVRGILKEAPSIIVRRINAVGWQPIPVTAAAAAAEVIGVITATPRVWGLVTGPKGPLTVIGIQPEDVTRLPGAGLTEPLAPGQAVVGSGIDTVTAAGGLLLSGTVEKRFDIIDRLPRELGIVAHDLVLLHMGDARRLLGVPEGYASDLAVEVFHAEEQDAILPDLSRAFPWPVRLVSQNESMGIYSAGYGRYSAIVLITLIPAVLAVCLMVAVNIRQSVDRKKDLAILKSLGWTTGDIVRLLFYRVAFLGFPSAAFGMAAAFLLVFGPANRWIGTVLFGWRTLPPLLCLDPQGAVVILLEVVAFALIPFMGSALAPALIGAARDVQELLQGVED